MNDGKLTLPLLFLTDVCVRFADVQPAPRGNLFVHCGGPGKLSRCLLDMGKSPHKYGYNVIGIDQVILLVCVFFCVSSLS